MASTSAPSSNMASAHVGVRRFVYDPLPVTTDAIRLLEVLPDLQDGMIQARITNSARTRAYTTVSYMWGPTTHGKQILLNGSSFDVRRNLWDFLCLARQHYHGTLFWIDAVCIDQSNIAERNQQVACMDAIYGSAVLTLIWLGAFVDTNTPPTSANCSVTTSALRDVDAELEGCKGIPDDPRSIIDNRPPRCFLPPAIARFGPVCSILEEVCQHPYWTRVWIIQETILSSNKRILLPGMTMNWRPFSECLEWVMYGNRLPFPGHLRFMARRRLFRTAIAQERNSYRQKQSLSPFPVEASWRVPHVVSSLLVSHVIPSWASRIERDRLQKRFDSSLAVELSRSDSKIQVVKGLREWFDCVTRFSKSACEDRRDKLFGLAALNGGTDRMRPDYTADVYETYFRACRYFALDGDDSPKFHFISARPLLHTINLGPMDMVFGDKQNRSRVFATDSNPIGPSGKYKLIMKEATIAGLEAPGLFTLEGHCHRCHRDIIFEVYEPSSETYFIVQCHGDGASQPSTSAQEQQIKHLVLYESSYQPDGHLDSDACKSFSSQHSTSGLVHLPPTPTPSLTQIHRHSLHELIWLLRVQRSFYEALHAVPPSGMYKHAKRQRDYAPPIHDPRLRHGLQAQPLHIFLKRFLEPETDIRGMKYTREALNGTFLEPQAQQNFVKALEEQGFQMDK